MAVRAEEEALPSVVWPVTARVPCEERLEVAVMLPPVRVFIVAVIAFNIEAKKFVEVAFASDVAPYTDKFVAVVVARVEVPVIERVPFELREEVAVIVPEVMF